METEFNFDSVCTSPFITAPSSPCFFKYNSQFDHNFEFDFVGFTQRLSLSDANDLFSEGRIKPLKPPPCVHFVTVRSPRSPKSPAKIFVEALSRKKKEFDPFEEAIKQSQNSSPLRVSNILSEDQTEKTKKEKNALFSFSKSVWKQYKKWKLKDFLLFRNASESRKDQISNIKKHKNFEEDVKSSSFRSMDSFGSGTRRKGSLSAHEEHYIVNRAVKEEMKKTTTLPYKHGLMGMGCLGFEPPVHDLVRNFGSSRT